MPNALEKEFIKEQSEYLASIDKDVINAMYQFLWCSKKDLEDSIESRIKKTSSGSVTLSNINKTRDLHSWYLQLTIPKTTPGEFRTLSIPNDTLKSIQSNLLTSLRSIPISSASQWGEPGTSFVKNAKIHVPNKYLYVSDISNAYPSVSAQRIYKNIEWPFGKILDLSFPYLTKEQKKQFLMIVVLLVSYRNELPQWAPTSTRLLNIIMANTDKEILTFLHSDKSNIHNALYTRYLDDIAVSFKDFKSYVVIEEKLKNTHHQLKSLFDNQSNVDNWTVFYENIGIAQKSFQELISIPCDFDDDYNISRVRTAMLSLKSQLADFYNNSPFKANDHIAKAYYEIDKLIIDYIKLLNWSDSNNWTEILVNELRKIIANNWWKIKKEKEHTRWRNASTAREITWVTIWHDGKLGIANKKMEHYQQFVKTAFMFPDKLPSRFFDKETLQIDWQKLWYELNGIRNYIMQVKWHVPENFEKYFQWCKIKYFPKIKNHYNTSYGIVQWAAGL
jgi:hypothetical protein